MLCQPGAGFLRVEYRPHGRRGSALHNAFLKKALCIRGGHKSQHFGPAARLPEYGHILRVPSKGLNVILYPLKGIYNVHHAYIGRILVLIAIGGKIQKSKGIEPVVYTYHYHVSVPAHIFSVKLRFIGRTCGKSAAVEPYHNRTFFSVIDSRSPNI